MTSEVSLDDALRLLEEYEWVDDDRGTRCVMCGGEKPSDSGPISLSAPDGHGEGCEWLSFMRKVGRRSPERWFEIYHVRQDYVSTAPTWCGKRDERRWEFVWLRDGGGDGRGNTVAPYAPAKDTKAIACLACCQAATEFHAAKRGAE